MKIGINLLLWTGHVTQEHFPLFDQLRAAGYDGVEVPIMDLSDPGHFERVGRAVREAGLACTASTILPDEARSAISENPAHRRAAVDHLRAAIDCAQRLGAGVLMGPYFQVIGLFTGAGPTSRELEHAAAVHRAIAPVAQAAGIRCALEPLNRFEAHLINTMEQAVEYLARVDHPWFGATHDTFHAHIEEKDPIASIRTLHSSGKLFHVHVSENDRGVPGQGHARLREAIAELRRLGYDEWLTIEAFGSTLPSLAAATRVWRPFFASPEEVYREGVRFIREAWSAAG